MDVIDPRELEAFVAARTEPRVRPIAEMYDLLSEMYVGMKEGLGAGEGIPVSAWPAFTSAYGGARAGDVVVITGETAMGKTTFATNWLTEMVRQGVPCLLVSLEMRWKAMVKKIAQMIQGKPFRDFGPADMNGVYEVLKTLPLYVLSDRGMVSERTILDAIGFAHQKYGTKVAVIDHLDFIDKRSEKSWQSEAYVIQEFMGRLCGVAEDNETCAIVIVHPAKTQVKGVIRREIGLDELKGSSAIKQCADTVIGVFQPDPDTTETRIRFLKVREDGYSRCSFRILRYNFLPESLRLEEMSTAPELSQ